MTKGAPATKEKNVAEMKLVASVYPQNRRERKSAR